MRIAILVLLVALVGLNAYSQNTALKTGVFNTYRAFGKNEPASDTGYRLVPFVRVNTIDLLYNDTLYRLIVNGKEERTAFGVYDGSRLFVNAEDSLYREMDFIGRFPFASVSNKIHLPEGYVIENKTPIWKEERNEVHTYIAFVNKQGKLVPADFETIWAFLKGDNDLSKPFGKEKHVNETFRKYIVMMNERYPL